MAHRFLRPQSVDVMIPCVDSSPGRQPTSLHTWQAKHAKQGLPIVHRECSVVAS